MRLISARTLELVEYHGNSIPRYAILSHTWGEQEISFQDAQSQSQTVTGKAGWWKIEQACKIALQHGLEFLWIDTCCIDKTNSVELGEAINSMFQWYKNSALCIAYLADLRDQFPSESVFACRWWQRGWTLQELIAPTTLKFYNAAWQYNGTKSQWEDFISNRIGIPPAALRGDLSPPVGSIAQKFSWAANRETTRVEDEAYCLLGIFDVNMPLLYGEGRKAFRRLQEEIIKTGNDLTIFAHSPMRRTKNLFAEGVNDFRDLGELSESPRRHPATQFSLTNRGLHIAHGLLMHYVSVRTLDDDEIRDTYYASLGMNSLGDVGICLVKVAPQVYYRDDKAGLVGYVSEIKVFKGKPWYAVDYYMIPHRERYTVFSYHDMAIYLPSMPGGETFQPTTQPAATTVKGMETILHEIVPRNMFYYVQQSILRGSTNVFKDGNLNTVIALKGSIYHTKLYRIGTFVNLMDVSQDPPAGLIFEAARHKRLVDFLFTDENSEKSITWPYLRMMYPEVEQFRTSMVFVSSASNFEVSVRFRENEDPEYSLSFCSQYALELDVTRF